MVAEKKNLMPVNIRDLLCESGISQANLQRMIDGILETFPRVFSFRKSRIKENSGKIKITPKLHQK